MKWERANQHLLTSNTIPEYKVARFVIDGEKLFRAAFKGEFIGETKRRAREAQDICERHHQINQEAKELPDGTQKPAERGEVPA